MFSLCLLVVLLPYGEVHGNVDAKRLLHELMKDYNKNVLPVQSINQKVNVTLGLKLSQLSDIDERNQIMTTNVWLEHVRSPPRLSHPHPDERSV